MLGLIPPPPPPPLTSPHVLIRKRIRLEERRVESWLHPLRAGDITLALQARGLDYGRFAQKCETRLLHRHTTLTIPHHHAGQVQTFQNIVKGRFDPISDEELSPVLIDLVHSMISVDPASRPAVHEVLRIATSMVAQEMMEGPSRQNTQGGKRNWIRAEGGRPGEEKLGSRGAHGGGEGGGGAGRGSQASPPSVDVASVPEPIVAILKRDDLTKREKILMVNAYIAGQHASSTLMTSSLGGDRGGAGGQGNGVAAGVGAGARAAAAAAAASTPSPTSSLSSRATTAAVASPPAGETATAKTVGARRKSPGVLAPLRTAKPFHINAMHDAGLDWRDAPSVTGSAATANVVSTAPHIGSSADNKSRSRSRSRSRSSSKSKAKANAKRPTAQKVLAPIKGVGDKGSTGKTRRDHQRRDANVQ